MEKWEQHLEQAQKHFKIADHMSYVTFSLLKENRLIIKILVEISEAVSNLIKSFLYYEYSLKRAPLYKDPKLNLKTFKEKIAPKYMGRQELETLIKILEINKKHRQSSLEFVKKDKFVILLRENYETLTIEKIKEFLGCFRKVMKNFPEQRI